MLTFCVYSGVSLTYSYSQGYAKHQLVARKLSSRFFMSNYKIFTIMKKFLLLISTLMSICFALVAEQNQPTGVFMNLLAEDQYPNAISENGAWAVGSEFDDNVYYCYINASKWNLETGEHIFLVKENEISNALCINNEGTVVGGSYLGQPAYWLESDGLWHTLPMPQGYANGSGDVTAMAIVDGDTIMVGYVIASQMDDKIIRWKNGKIDNTFKYRDYNRYAEITGDTIKCEMQKLRGMSTDGKRYLISLDYGCLPMAGTTNLPTTFIQTEDTSVVIDREFDIYDLVSFVEEAAMSHNGKFVCGSIYAVPRDGVDATEVATISFTYDVDNDKFTHYGNIENTGCYASATCIDNEGHVYFKSMNGVNPLGKPYIFKNGEYIELEKCLLAYEGITAEQIDAMITDEVEGSDEDDLGIVWAVSGDGKTLIGAGGALKGNIWCAKLSCSPYDLTDKQIAQGGNPTDIETSKISSANVYTRNGTLYVEGATENYHVLDAAGRLIYSGNATTLQLPRGIYLVTINGEIQKVVL